MRRITCAFIFHYTDVVGLLGILDSRCLFATDYRFLNDATEGSMIKDLIVPIFESEITDLMPKLEAKGLIKGFYDFHGTSGHHSLAEASYRQFVDLVNKYSPLFILSFCRHEEGSQHFRDGLLSQWRAYGGAGGFALEFDEQGIDELMKMEPKKFAYGGLKSEEVRYDGCTDVFKPDPYKGVAGEIIRTRIEPHDIAATKTIPNVRRGGLQERQRRG
jgi:hypothetical protein